MTGPLSAKGTGLTQSLT